MEKKFAKFKGEYPKNSHGYTYHTANILSYGVTSKSRTLSRFSVCANRTI